MTFVGEYQSLRVNHVGRKVRGIVGPWRRHERGGPVPDRSDPPERGGGPLWREGWQDWRGWRRRENGQQRWVNK